MTKRQYLRERPHKEDFYARADESETARLTLQQMLARGEEAEPVRNGTGATWGARHDAGAADERRMQRRAEL